MLHTYVNLSNFKLHTACIFLLLHSCGAITTFTNSLYDPIQAGCSGGDNVLNVLRSLDLLH